VVARNKRSACGVEIRENGFDPDEVRAERIISVPVAVERSYRKSSKYRKWPWYVYGKTFFQKLGAQFRVIDDKHEMLLSDVVYLVEDFVPCSITRDRSIGRKAISELRSDPELRNFEYRDEDIWDDASIHLITALGMCLATCQTIEHYIANSFFLGISKQQKQKYKTLSDLRRGWERKTLGNMVRSIEEAWEIEPILKANLELFVTNRNLLIHGITTNDRYDIRTHWGREELVAFLSFFDVHARVVKMAFRSSYYASVHIAITRWGRPKSLSNRSFGRKHEKEARLFYHFFAQKWAQYRPWSRLARRSTTYGPALAETA
jgi:hypothetical protein